MKFLGAEFTFKHPSVEYKIVVRFGSDVVWVRCAGKAYRIENRPRKYGGCPYKPCMTHAMQAAHKALPEPPEQPRNEFERQREDSVKPTSLRIVRGS